MENMNTYIPKEISWLSFNARVLQEASDKSVPLIERVRFLGIYSSNQDEFFKVRVADLKRQIIINKEKGNSEETAKLLRKVQSTTSDYQKVMNKIYNDLLDELAKKKIFLKDENQINEEQKKWIKSYFKRHVLKHIRPVIVTESIDLVSFLKDQYTYLLVKMFNKKGDTYALIEIPSDTVPRFIRMPSDTEGETTLMFLDNVIRIGLDTIFKGYFDYDNIEAYSIKMNRDAEYDLQSSVDKGVLETMSDSLKQRLNAKPVRFAYDRAMPKDIVEFMAGKLKMSEIDSLMPGNRYHNFKDFLSFPSVGSDDMENPSLPSIHSTAFDLAATPFEAIAQKDILLYYPYYSFEYFTEVLRQAAIEATVHGVGFRHGRFAHRQGDRSTAFEVGDKQRPRLTDAVAPLRDVVAVQSAAGLLGGIARLHQLALAAHGFFTISIGMIQVRQVGGDAYQRGHYQHGACLEELGQGLFAPRLLEVSAYDEQDDEQEVVGHLYVVGRHLQSHKDGSQDASGQQPAPIGQHDARQRGRNIGQRDKLPDVPRRNKNEEIGRESPHHAP